MDEHRLLEIIAEFTNYDADQLEPDMHFVDDLGIDSLDLAQIILSAESEFDVELEEEVADGIETVGDAIELLKAKLEEQE